MCDLVTDTLASVVLGYFACAIWIFSCQSCCLKANGFTLPGGSSRPCHISPFDRTLLLFILFYFSYYRRDRHDWGIGKGERKKEREGKKNRGEEGQ